MNLSIQTEDSFSNLLDLAANNDINGFKLSIERDPASIDEIDRWYGRQKGSNHMELKRRTPLMVAATYGSIDVLKFILSLSAADVTRTCSSDKSTALHCAASGGSANAIEAVKQLLLAGADLNSLDSDGRRPFDVIAVSPKLPNIRSALEELLAANSAPIGDCGLRVSTSSSGSPPLSSSPEDGSPSSASDSTSSPMMAKFHDLPANLVSEKKEYPMDPSLPDIKNSIYATDEFRMFSFKIRPCSRAYSHDWTECPFVHPGENARRRDPRKYHYSCVPCPDFRKGACRRGDLCEYAHGVFECWLHPAQYRTRLCKDGTACARRVCFFAHTSEELRPLYVSTGSAVPSPRSAANAAAAMDMAAAMSLLPGSPSSLSVMSPNPFTPPMSPSANGMSWPQPNVPALHLPGSNLQSSRLRSSFNARDIPSDEFPMLQDFDAQLLNDFSCFSPRTRLNAASGNFPARPKTLTPSNLDDLFTAEISSSPRFSDQMAASVFSPSHKSAILNNQFQHHHQQQQQQSMLSPINTNVFSPKAGDQHMASPFGLSPRSFEAHSPMSSRLGAFSHREQQQQQQFRSLSSRELGSGASAAIGSSLNSMARWGSPTGKVDWSVNGDELGKLKRSSSFEMGAEGEEPDLSWVQSLVKESPDIKEKEAVTIAETSTVKASSSGETANSNSNSQAEGIDYAVLGAWLEQMQLDQLLPQ